jgi:hypothetical protein
MVATLLRYSGLIAFFGILLLGILTRWVRVFSRPRGEQRAYLIYRAIRRMISVAIFLGVVLLIEGGVPHLIALGVSVPLYVRVIFVVVFLLDIVWLGVVVRRVIRARAAWSGKPPSVDMPPFGSDAPLLPQ